MTPYADLHTHTTASDGTFPPDELALAARQRDIAYLAVTDHDTTAALPQMARLCASAGIYFLPGVELSADGPPGKCHLLGLGIDPANAALNETLAYLAGERRTRNERMAARLRSLGVEITLDEVTAAAPPGANVGRPHFAQTLVEKGVVASLPEAFTKYLGDTAAAYVPKAVLPPADAIALIHGAGGLAFLAHPALVRYAEQETPETRLTALKQLGLDGVEAYYPRHSPAQTERYVRLAEKLGLLVTGGSDFHGANKPDIVLGGVLDEGAAPLPADHLPDALLSRCIAPSPGSMGTNTVEESNTMATLENTGQVAVNNSDDWSAADAAERLPYLYDLAGNLELDLESVSEHHPTESLSDEHIERYNRVLRAARILLPDSVALKEDVGEIDGTTRADQAYHDLHTTIVPTLHNALPDAAYRSRG